MYSFSRSSALLIALFLVGCQGVGKPTAQSPNPIDVQPPLQTIRREHKVISKIANAAAKDAQEMKKTGRIDRQRIEKYIDFFSNFTDACHHRKEELYLFPAVEWHDREEDVIRTLREEHNRGRILLGKMRKAMPVDGDPDVKALAAALIDYADMLAVHIKRENEQLLPNADQLLNREERQRVAEGYVYVEHELLGEGFHQKYHALAQSLIDK